MKNLFCNNNIKVYLIYIYRLIERHFTCNKYDNFYNVDCSVVHGCDGAAPYAYLDWVIRTNYLQEVRYNLTT